MTNNPENRCPSRLGPCFNIEDLAIFLFLFSRLKTMPPHTSATLIRQLINSQNFDNTIVSDSDWSIRSHTIPVDNLCKIVLLQKLLSHQNHFTSSRSSTCSDFFEVNLTRLRTYLSIERISCNFVCQLKTIQNCLFKLIISILYLCNITLQHCI